ncbi:MAG: hypothetical protein JWO19_1852 [Bryobacterales bacterium]|jgi:hypothetical protein|nr:hypothetical protein [Bryobacterales bacterium]
MKSRTLFFAALAFAIGSPAWASSSWCLDSCSAAAVQFINMQLPQNISLDNTSVFASYQQQQYSSSAMPSVVLSAGSDTWNAPAATYTASQISSVLTVPSFSVGITANNNSMQVNQLFQQQSNTFMNGTVSYTLGNGGNGLFALAMASDPKLAIQFLTGTGSGTGSSTNFLTTFSSTFTSGLNTSNAMQFLTTNQTNVSSQQFLLVDDAPEPGTFGLMGSALAILALWAKRRRLAPI